MKEIADHILKHEVVTELHYEENSYLAKLGKQLLGSIQKFGFINGVDNVNWPPYRDSKS